MFLSKEEVNKLRLRTALWKETEYEGCDPLMPSVYDKFLVLDSLATVFSCEGHNPKEDPDREKSMDFYIMFATTEEGFWKLLQLQEKMNAGLQALKNIQISQHDLRLTLVNRIHLITPHVSYRSVILSMDNVNESKDKEVFFKILHDGIDSLLIDSFKEA